MWRHISASHHPKAEYMNVASLTEPAKFPVPPLNAVRPSLRTNAQRKNVMVIQKQMAYAAVAAAAFLGVAFLAAAFLGVAFFAAGLAVVFATRPDLVFVRVLGLSTTAGA